MPVVYLLRVLGNNWSLVEIVVDKMGRGTNDLYAPLIGLPVGAVPHKRGQKRMVNVHDPVVVMGHKVGGEHAHVFGQNKVIGLVDGKGAQHGGFMFLARISFVRNMMEWNAKLAHQRLQRGIIAHHGQNVGPQFVESVADEQFAEAVVLFGNEHHHVLFLLRIQPQAYPVGQGLA